MENKSSDINYEKFSYTSMDGIIIIKKIAYQWTTKTTR